MKHRPTQVAIAAVAGAHGIGGEVRLKVFAENFAAYKSFNDGALSLKSARAGNNGMIARFAEVADRNADEAMRGTELTVPRSSLPPPCEARAGAPRSSSEAVVRAARAAGL